VRVGGCGIALADGGVTGGGGLRGLAFRDLGAGLGGGEPGGSSFQCAFEFGDTFFRCAGALVFPPALGTEGHHQPWVSWPLGTPG
jgi:hypothetical protein